MKVLAELDIPISNLCAIIIEADLYKEWLPFCKKSLLVKQINDFEKVVYIKMNIPIISPREGYLDGMGIDRLD